MKKFVKYFLILAVLPAFVLSSCKKDDDPTDPTVSAYETLSTYMVDNGMDLPAMLTNWVIAPDLVSKDVNGIVDPTDFSIPDYHVVDIRSASDFAAGHIKGAVNSTLANILTTAAGLGTDKPILVVCATGQTASQAVIALRLSGYMDAVVMKFGMAYWNADFSGAWDNSIGNIADGNANWVYDASPAFSEYSNPGWTSTATSGADILKARIETMLAAGFAGVSASDVLADPAAAGQIINFWPEADYTTLGHFTTALQMQPIGIATGQVKNFDPSVPTLIYCYTGQTSAMVVSWLNVLGYDAKSVKFGVNALAHDALDAAGKPAWHAAHDYDYVTGK